MLYHYYMKINIKYLFIPVLLCCLFPCAWAQVTVVKQDGQKVYLDTSDYNRTVSVGQTFKVIVSQDILKNPKTGKELGKVNQYSSEGKIIEVQPLYAIGEFSSPVNLSIGQEAVIEEAAPVSAAKPTTTAAVQTPIKKASNRKTTTYPVIEGVVISAIKANLNALAGEEIATVDTDGILTVYTGDSSSLQAVAQYKIPAGKKFITLSAKDIMDGPYAQLFAVVYDEKTQKISTLILQSAENSIRLLDTVPYFTKEIGCNDDKDLYAQKPFISNTKAGDARELDYDDGRFRLEDDRLNTRGHWLMGMNYYEIQNREYDNFVYTSSNGRIRLRLKNGKYIESDALFAGTPNRVKYKQDIVSFYPSLQVYGPDGMATLAAVENTTKLGLLSEQFGQYNGSKIHFLTYQNGILETQETLELNGFLYDTNCTARGILAPQVLSSGQTVLTEIYR